MVKKTWQKNRGETKEPGANGMSTEGLTRRHFLAGAGIMAAGAASTGLAACSTSPQTTTMNNSSSGTGLSTQQVSWDYEADIIVVGTGPAGLACAAAAAEEGITVIAIDANDKIGGKGILAGGNLGIGGGTRMQIDAGYEETADIIYEDRTVPNLRTDKTMVVDTIDHREYEMGQWRKISGTEDGDGMARAFADNSLDTWNWLVAWEYLLLRQMLARCRQCIVVRAITQLQAHGL
ncbi:MAG: FAD-dependent oxidoreductase [Coriobacteriales bacterium]|nr:FAD-dependent oxidoreductase [Coriobacteriales bacterium]